ncbi:MAG TPA: tryptophan-rich sensory protein [Candidatus Ruania gallistercoris]|uniref:Tryptophan-rich sensory protein n=1 Tax=Candidatus Ruania gallistercoris TaxID=2838746 RepID=A0A9D2ED18_9MICO|nr:tryptophan-rich sensory protein [Candidatus Ruania gallistercoris]
MRPTPADRVRQIVVTASLIGCLVGSTIGVGAFGGTPISEAAGGALSADATLLAPASGAFSIWTVIYIGLAGYVVYQWLPVAAPDPRQRRLGYPVAASMLLNAAWILVVQAGALGLSVLVITVLLAVLAAIVRVLTRSRRRGWLDLVLVDGTLGLYLGWVCVATAANVAAALAAAGFEGAGRPAELWAVLVLAAVALVGVALAFYTRGRLAVATSIVWGLIWIGIARTGGDPSSVQTAVGAWTAAAGVLVVTVARRLWVILSARDPAAVR